MNPDIFPKYLHDPSLLYRITYQELKTLVVQYPYCQNLRYLLLIKSKIENNKDQERNLKMASAYSLDRSTLYELYKKTYAYEEKEIEFLDLNSKNETDSELNLPILDFTNGINAKENSNLIEEDIPPLELNMDPIPAKDEINLSEEEDLAALFDDVQVNEDEITKVEASTIDSIIYPLIPPINALPVFNLKKTEEKSEKVEEEKIKFNLPLIPPIQSIPVFHILPKKEEKKTELKVQLPLIPPIEAIPHFIFEEKDELKATELKPTFSVNHLLVPSIADLPRFQFVSKDKAEEVLLKDSYEAEIDISIKEALDDLAQKQRLEDFQEEESILKKMSLEHQNEGFEEELEDLTPIANIPEVSNRDKELDKPKSSFSEWLKSMKAPKTMDNINLIEEEATVSVKTVSKVEKPKKKKKKKKNKSDSPLMKIVKAKREEDLKKEIKKDKIKKRKVIEMANQSLKEKEDIVSETLAKILIEQEKYNKAIKMYRRLSLKFPEKSSYFAGEIEKINKIIE